MMLTSFSNIINKALALDPESSQRIKKLHGKVISFELLPLHFRFECCFNENGLQIVKDETLVPDAILRGTPIQMLSVMITKENRHRFFADDLVIEGNAETGQQVIDLFDRLQIDWEEQLSKIIGDVPAYHTARALNKFKSFLDDSGKSIIDNINEFAHEEARWLPSREALNDFFSEIDSMRMDVDRAEARINRLRDALNMTEEKP